MISDINLLHKFLLKRPKMNEKKGGGLSRSNQKSQMKPKSNEVRKYLFQVRLLLLVRQLMVVLLSSKV